MDPAKPEIACIFWDDVDDAVREKQITIAPTLTPDGTSLRHGCQDHCLDNGMRVWAQPVVPGEPDSKWAVFELQRRMGAMLVMVPHRAAAEMWIIHNVKRV